MSSWKSAGLALAFLSLAACDPNLSTPRGAVMGAAQAVQQGRLDQLQYALGGEALAQYGNAAGLETLRARASQFKNFSFSRERFLGSQKGDQGHGTYGDVQRSFETALLGTDAAGRRQIVATLEVDCEVWMQKDSDTGPANDCIVRGNGEVICTPNFGSSGGYSEMQSCRVTQLR